MNQPEAQQEPLNNVALESAILGLRMALTPEEEVEARQKFLDILRDSHVAVPTLEPAPTAPDGSLLPDANLSLVVLETKEGVSGVPVFTQLGGLRATLPNVENGIFMLGAQLAGMLASSPHKLFVDGPDLHAEVEQSELQAIVESTQKIMAAQQQAAQQNTNLESALADLAEDDSAATREAVTTAFLQGFSRVPIAGEADKDVECLVMTFNNQQQPGQPQEVELLTQDGAVMCFTSEAMMQAWDQTPRNAIVLPGPAIAQMVAQTGAGGILVNPKHENSKKFRVEPDKIILE